MDHILSSIMVERRAELVRWFYYRVGQDSHLAEDLAQETLIEAWDNRGKLSDPSGVTAWLYAIARNIFKRWARRQSRHMERVTDLDEAKHGAERHVNIALSRNELIALLDRTLNALPAKTRQIIVMRYLEGRPQAQVAEYMGLSESAVAVRLHRGKLELRARLAAEERGKTQSARWQRTSIWCPGCGQHRYEGKLDSQTGELLLRCPGCASSSLSMAWEHRETAGPRIVKGLSTFKPAFNRILDWAYERFTLALRQGTLRCTACDGEVLPRFGGPDAARRLSVHYVCPHCHNVNHCALSSMALIACLRRQPSRGMDDTDSQSSQSGR
jgi:RNA polymerase sigma-70 factor (ECF subfamily)